MRHVHQIQTQLTVSPLSSLDPNLIAVKLLGLCSSLGNLTHGCLSFSHVLAGKSPNIIAHNALLSSLARHSRWQSLLSLFRRQFSGESLPKPDEFTFTSVLKACSALSLSLGGQNIHSLVVKYGCAVNVFVMNSLVGFYFKVKEFEFARKVFDEMPVRDVVSWNTVLAGYCGCGRVGEAREVFDAMPERSPASWAAMLTGYAKSGDLGEAWRFFDGMPERNVVCWNAMVSGCVRNEKYGEAVGVFRRMVREVGSGVNELTLLSVLCACAHLGALDLGVWVDGFVRRRKMEVGLFLGNALADMYAKCGCVDEARRVFDSMRERDVISWSVIVTGLAMNGRATEAFDCFEEMLGHGVVPNDTIFVGLLTACTHVGLVEKGLEYFESMEQVYGITPKVEHYGCLVDLLSRAGRLDQAEEKIGSMPVKPNVIVWGALLGGCRIHKDPERGERVVRRILELEPGHSGCYVYLANLYASTGRLEEAAECRLKMRNNSMTKMPGCSWIEVDGVVHEFFMGGSSHPLSDHIYAELGELRRKMKLAGYEPKTDLVVHSVDEEEKEDALSVHSEKLAIVFGLISTPEGTTIRIVKNLRICDDCHDAMKIISKIVDREIVIRDRSRFHHIKDGKCSCNGYW